MKHWQIDEHILRAPLQFFSFVCANGVENAHRPPDKFERYTDTLCRRPMAGRTFHIAACVERHARGACVFYTQCLGCRGFLAIRPQIICDDYFATYPALHFHIRTQGCAFSGHRHFPSKVIGPNDGDRKGPDRQSPSKT